jgi:hypothetical protein
MIYQVYLFIYLSFKLDFDYLYSYFVIGAPQIEEDFNMLDISNKDTNDDISGIFIIYLSFK